MPIVGEAREAWFADSGGWGCAEFENDTASDTFTPGTVTDQAPQGMTPSAGSSQPGLIADFFRTDLLPRKGPECHLCLRNMVSTIHQEGHVLDSAAYLAPAGFAKRRSRVVGLSATWSFPGYSDPSP
jgi:hypothetical protein